MKLEFLNCGKWADYAEKAKGVNVVIMKCCGRVQLKSEAELKTAQEGCEQVLSILDSRSSDV